MNSPEVSCYMSPLPVGSQIPNPSSSVKGDDPPVNPKGKGDPNRKGAGKGKGPSVAELLKKCLQIASARCLMESFYAYAIRVVSVIANERSVATMVYTSATTKGATKTDPIRSVIIDKAIQMNCTKEFPVHCVITIRDDRYNLPCL